MEEEQSGPEKQDQPDEQQQQQQEGPTQQTGGTTAVRSYECNFCKRGFTNAQALGGHMNIHRKDKAKLKQSSTQIPTPQPQHIPPSPFFPPPNIFHHPMDDQKGGKWFSSSKEPIATNSTDHKSKSTHEGKQQQLPLLGTDHQTASGIENQNPLPLIPAEVPELDLELRLGHNIDLPSSDHSSKGTRRFF